MHWIQYRRLAAMLLLVACGPATMNAVQVASPFSAHMVLQREKPLPVWGWAESGEEITVSFADQNKTARAGRDGEWRVQLDPLAACGEPRSMTIRGAGKAGELRIDDILVGEVWLCGGQSNMERLLGARGGKGVAGQDEAIAMADVPQIRQLMVERAFSLTPKATGEMSWTVCSPKTAGSFTAVGFFFARELFRHLRVPIGIIDSSYGGSAAEAWMSVATTKRFPEIYARLTVAANEPADPQAAWKYFLRNTECWFERHDPGTAGAWQRPDLDTSAWEDAGVPGIWEYSGHPSVDGVGWYRKSFSLPSEWKGKDLVLHLGVVDDGDTTWINGRLLGSTFLYGKSRSYRVPASALVEGENVVAVRVQDFGNDGGFVEPDDAPFIAPAGQPRRRVSLAGLWKMRVSLASIENIPIPPQEQSRFGIWVPGNLYHSMILPLAPFAIRGFAFYQGETNTSHAKEYQQLLPALIADWRRTWADETLPFLFVQIAPYRSSRPEMREAQELAWKRTARTAMVATIDGGDADDIHPAEKASVGARLALAARALAYSGDVEFSGPVFHAVRFESDKAVLEFTHLGGGLVGKGGALRGFEVAGADGSYVAARAEIRNDNVIVSAPGVADPKLVRYDWANVPDGNLYNAAGLPASSFRTAGAQR
jgi:sialate O-acetylesterase